MLDNSYFYHGASLKDVTTGTFITTRQMAYLYQHFNPGGLEGKGGCHSVFLSLPTIKQLTEGKG